MIQRFDERHVGKAARLAAAFALAAMGIAILGFTGFCFIRPLTCAGILLSGLTLLILLRRTQTYTPAFAAAGGVVLLGVVKAADFATGYVLRGEELLFPSMSLADHGPMPLTGFFFILIGSGLVLLNIRSRMAVMAAQWAAALAAAVAYFGVTAHIYKMVNVGTTQPYFYGMSWSASVAFSCLSAAVFLVFPRQGLVTVFTNNTLGGAMARRCLPAVLLVIPFLGMVHLALEERGILSYQVGLGIFITVNVITLSGLVFYVCHYLAKRDLEYRGLMQKYQDSLSKQVADMKFALDASCVISFTDREGRITYVNDRFCDISKYTREELIGRDHRVVNSGHHRKGFFKALWMTIERGEVWRGEIKNRAKDGSLYWVETTIVPFLDAGGRPYQFVEVCTDITQRRLLGERLGALSLSMIQLQEEERARIARDIHDDLGQSLIAFKMGTQGTFAKLPPLEEQHRRQLARIIAEINGIIDKTRTIAYTLRPSTFEVLGLKTSLETLADEVHQKNGLWINMELVELDHLVFRADAINLYRFLQEALNNVVKHAQATRVDIAMRLDQERLTLRIRDNGRGFSAPKGGRDWFVTTLGLNTMRERVRLLEGELYISSRTGEGTTIEAVCPVTLKEGKYAQDHSRG